MIPLWLHTLAWLSLAAALACAGWVVWDETLRPQNMKVMNAVWPLCALFGGPLLLVFYLGYGRATAQAPHGRTPAFGVQTAKAALHCGSGCTLGDIVAETLAFTIPATAVWFGWHSLFDEKTFAVWGLDFLLAFLFGIIFQYFTIAPMRNLGLWQGLLAALKADTLSLAAWQVGMYGFMAFAQFYLFRSLIGVNLEASMPEFWFMMQLAMLAGFTTSYPVNAWLLKQGLKEAM